MKKLLFSLANVLAGVVLVLLLLDPTRPLTPIFILLALSVALCVVAAKMQPEPTQPPPPSDV